VFLSGISVPDREVLDLARRLRATGFDEEAEKLEDAHRREVRILALEIAEREAILRALEECPDGSLAELRATILRDVTWFRQQGLAYRLDGSLDPSCGEHRPRPMAGVARAASPNTDGAEGPRLRGRRARRTAGVHWFPAGPCGGGSPSFVRGRGESVGVAIHSLARFVPRLRWKYAMLVVRSEDVRRGTPGDSAKDSELRHHRTGVRRLVPEHWRRHERNAGARRTRAFSRARHPAAGYSRACPEP
jgi:hypothetical protein